MISFELLVIVPKKTENNPKIIPKNDKFKQIIAKL